MRSGGSGNPLWNLEQLAGPMPDLSRVTVLSDVTNPLLGSFGAAAVFAPQKGATSEQVAHLEAQLTSWADELARIGRPVADLAGAGAAGGVGRRVPGPGIVSSGALRSLTPDPAVVEVNEDLKGLAPRLSQRPKVLYRLVKRGVLVERLFPVAAFPATLVRLDGPEEPSHAQPSFAEVEPTARAKPL